MFEKVKKMMCGRTTAGARLLRNALLVFVSLVFLGGVPLAAQDAPHWLGKSIDIDCTSQCHVAHHALSGGLNSTTGNLNLCLSCHNASGLAGDLPFTIADRAVPGESGRSHAFDVSATNSGAGALPPTDGEMDRRLPDGNIICSTCHNQHRAEIAFGGRPRVAAATKVVATTGTGVLASGGVFAGAEGVWYLIEIMVAGVEANPGAAAFGYSKDNGTSWFPTNCVPGGATSGCLDADGGNPVALDSGVTVTFGAGTQALGEQWEFSASYPFLRSALSAGGSGTNDLCWQCHQSWVHTSTDVETYNQGVKKSHPNGIPYGDRSSDPDYHDTPRDGNGAFQISGPDGDVDSNATNDMRLFGGNVECLTCHGVHFVDSNTQTVDMP